jgi:hypothetical protein
MTLNKHPDACFQTELRKEKLYLNQLETVLFNARYSVLLVSASKGKTSDQTIMSTTVSAFPMINPSELP